MSATTRFINCIVLSDLVLLRGTKRNIPSPRQTRATLQGMSDTTAREKKKVILQTQLMGLSNPKCPGQLRKEEKLLQIKRLSYGN